MTHQNKKSEKQEILLILPNKIDTEFVLNKDLIILKLFKTVTILSKHETKQFPAKSNDIIYSMYGKLLMLKKIESQKF